MFRHSEVTNFQQNGEHLKLQKRGPEGSSHLQYDRPTVEFLVLATAAHCRVRTLTLHSDAVYMTFVAYSFQLIKYELCCA